MKAERTCRLQILITRNARQLPEAGGEMSKGDQRYTDKMLQEFLPAKDNDTKWKLGLYQRIENIRNCNFIGEYIKFILDYTNILK